MKEEIVVVTGTGALLSINVGFIPDVIEITNTTSRASLCFNRFDSVNTLGIAVAAAGTKTPATAGIILPDLLDETKAFKLEAAAIVNVISAELIVSVKQLNYVQAIDHTPRFQDATESTGGIFSV